MNGTLNYQRHENNRTIPLLKFIFIDFDDYKEKLDFDKDQVFVNCKNLIKKNTGFEEICSHFLLT